MKINKQNSLKFKKVKKLYLPNIKRERIAAGVLAISITFLTSCNVDFSIPTEVASPFPIETFITEVSDSPMYTPIEEDIANETVSLSPSDDIKKEPSPTVSEVDSPVISSEISPSSSIEPTSETSEDTNLNGNDEMKMIALSFDDGPSKTNTLELLKILEDNDCTATFFMVGYLAEKYPEIVYSVYEAGHGIGNHSYDHSNFTTLTPEDMINNFQNTEQIIYDIINVYPTFFRPPGGNINDIVKTSITSPIALWSIDSNDWRKITDEEVVDNIISNLVDGRIILMHDTQARTVEICKYLIPEIKSLGYEIVSMEELFKAYSIDLKDGVVYSRVKKN